jgi:hypothetical protein
MAQKNDIVNGFLSKNNMPKKGLFSVTYYPVGAWLAGAGAPSFTSR